MIDLAPEQLAIVRRLLAVQVPECEVRAFGSRVLGKAKPHSDLDIALYGPVRLPLARLAALREAFQDCALPIRVDVIDWHAISENFRNIIAAKFEILQYPALPDAESAKLEQAIKANLRGVVYGG
jgi:predicted nucleotidyltransferase